MVRDGPFHSWPRFPHALHGFNLDIRGFQEMSSQSLDRKYQNFSHLQFKILPFCKFTCLMISITLQVGVGFLAQYMIKPLLGFVIALVFTNSFSLTQSLKNIN